MIREATFDDASSLAAISLEIWFGTFLQNGINAFFADYALQRYTPDRYKDILSRSSDKIWVSQNSEGIDGFIRVITGSVAPATPYSDTEISTLYVQPQHQRQGVGKELLKEVRHFCAQTDRPDVWLSVNAKNERAIKFYSRCGFEKFGETNYRIGDQTYPNDILRLVLSNATT
ncbi:GNAT family N-acetyltransferase [Agrobacterium vitis]|uniref:GNAT family N-acetyltransferase n=1 Tax=Agrobacterium vitis TaxID=373 RepID=A0AAE2RHT2_AGRVI|nr:GNAT family N-acetyltransferase [Agrobacterium vitis]MBF2717659.1 GNAT family N-acetyltransferase [Agrobacterium vitis]MVA22599.1 GNAT family N-acetyltransferase [Agrobacterium vitis]